MLRWSVGRHWRLRSRWTNSRQRARARQSALTLIALQARTIRCWFRFAWPARQGHRSFGRHPNTAGIQFPYSHPEKAQHNCKNNCAECQTAQTPCLKRTRSTQAYLAAPVSPVPGQNTLAKHTHRRETKSEMSMEPRRLELLTPCMPQRCF